MYTVQCSVFRIRCVTSVCRVSDSRQWVIEDKVSIVYFCERQLGPQISWATNLIYIKYYIQLKNWSWNMDDGRFVKGLASHNPSIIFIRVSKLINNSPVLPSKHFTITPMATNYHRILYTQLKFSNDIVIFIIHALSSWAKWTISASIGTVITPIIVV